MGYSLLHGEKYTLILRKVQLFVLITMPTDCSVYIKYCDIAEDDVL